MEKKNGKVIAIVNRKGGCGKTTTCKNLAYDLAVLNKRVLLIDFDPQKNTTKGLSNRAYKKTVIDLLKGVSLQRCIYQTRFKNLDIIAGNDYLASEEIPEGVIKAQLQQAKEMYDYIVVDTSPYFNKLTAELILAHDLVVIPTEINSDSIDGLVTTISELKALCQNNMKFKILYTKVDGTKETKRDMEELNAAFRSAAFHTFIRYNHISITRARKHTIPLSKRYHSAKATRDYEALAKELMEVI